MHPAALALSFVLALLLLVLLALLVLWQRQRRLKREAYIRHAMLPRGLFAALRQQHPHLSDKDCPLVAQALRQFFQTYLHGGRRPVSMPSRVVDDLWHAFILHTRTYQQFCNQTFGRFLHHTPAVVLGAQRDANAGLRRCFWHACRDDNIDPRNPKRLPLLFATRAKLKIAGGYVYVADCEGLRERTAACAVHCGSDFASPVYDGGSDGFGDRDGGGSDGGGSDGGSAGDGGGCGGE